jgi:antitoxin (DNA-binding transcriptional repressor) of toxin-antitoxin stability system
MAHLLWTIRETTTMAPKLGKETAIGVTAFKGRCLGLIDQVAEGKTDRIVLLKRNRPIAAIIPIQDAAEGNTDLWGAMRGTVVIAPGVDLTESAGEVWEAEQ